MQNLNLFAEEEYVELMRSKMDSEGLGIILIHQVIKSKTFFQLEFHLSLSQFLEEFYPDSAVTSCPDSFTLHHYNGLVRGEGAVVYFTFLMERFIEKKGKKTYKCQFCPYTYLRRGILILIFSLFLLWTYLQVVPFCSLISKLFLFSLSDASFT